MTSIRTLAYRRVMRTLRGMDAPGLSVSEQDCIREAADALLFSRNLDEADVRVSLADATVLCDALVNAERWTPRRARQLLDDVWACGPDVAGELFAAA